jgi:hypothetical protein
MKVRVLYPTAFGFMAKQPSGGDVVDVEEGFATAAIKAGYAEEAGSKVEQATKAPGEKRPVRRKPKSA